MRTMNHGTDLMTKLKLEPGMSPTRAIRSIREYLDAQPDPLKAANKIMYAFGLKPETNVRKAYIFAMTAIEKQMNDGAVDPKAVLEKADARINNLTQILGPTAFKMPDVAVTMESGKAKVKGKKGSKRAIAQQLYIENKDKGDKVVIDLVAEALGVSKQNAYTYVYLVKKDLK